MVVVVEPPGRVYVPVRRVEEETPERVAAVPRRLAGGLRVPTTRRVVPDAEALRTVDVRRDEPPLMTEVERRGKDARPPPPPRTPNERRAV